MNILIIYLYESDSYLIYFDIVILANSIYIRSICYTDKRMLYGMINFYCKVIDIDSINVNKIFCNANLSMI